ncbi:MAG: thioredoxin domain-containing protein [Candidatus Dojkabacteria bacterium]|nr:thioredoxin domain-containing protein [Candidatus Dojkabacteria bacterium]MDQ7020740.1 thioredoxin domain-containing protein [Candidatus Dojkabacteria bacterium]
MSEVSKENEAITINVQPFIMPITILLSVIIFALGFVSGLGSISDAIKESESDTIVVEGGSGNGGTAVANDPTPSAAPTPTTQGVTSIDDDAYLGDKDSAKVAIVEFTDFECPFCQRHHQQTYPSIIQDYVDSGDAIYVIRDYPLSFHEPVATQAAISAECVHELAGKKAYFEFTDYYFEATQSNGAGVSGGADAIADLAEEAGAKRSDFEKCLDEERYAEETADDLADGSAAGISGTPGFIVGVLNDDGSVEGELVSGAQPYSSFQTTIEKYL